MGVLKLRINSREKYGMKLLKVPKKVPKSSWPLEPLKTFDQVIIEVALAIARYGPPLYDKNTALHFCCNRQRYFILSKNYR
jgi:hypothetical protein